MIDLEGLEKKEHDFVSACEEIKFQVDSGTHFENTAMTNQLIHPYISTYAPDFYICHKCGSHEVCKNTQIKIGIYWKLLCKKCSRELFEWIGF